MAWRENIIQFLRDDRNDLLERIAFLEKGDCRMIQIRDGQQFDTTDEDITRMKVNLAEIEHLLAETGATYDA